MDDLKKLLGEELYKQVEAKLGDKQLFLHNKGEKVLIDDGKFIPYQRFEEIVHKNKSLTEQLAKAENDLKELGKLSKGNQELEEKLKQLQKESEAFKTELEKKEKLLQKQLALKEALLNEGVIDKDARDLLLAKFDMEKIEIENNTIKNFSELIKPIKENPVLSKLFGETKYKGREPFDNNNKPFAEFLSREEVEAMSQEEVNEKYELITKSMPYWNKSNNK